LRILLAEDNATNQMLAAALLEKEAHTVETVLNGKEALAALANRSFDVVLMDVQMPEMDGFEATSRIREQGRATGKHIPIVAMTAHAMKGDRERCLAAGMDGYVSKPIQAAELYQALASVVPSVPADSSTEQDALDAGSKRSRANDPGGVLDRAALLARVGGREDRLRTIIKVFLDESSGLMTELQEAIASGDASRLKLAAHSLKGAVGLFGVSGVTEAALTLETMGKAGELAGASEAFNRLEEEMHRLRYALANLLSPSPETLSAADQ
jgi:CheY-like chemotaxis protein/HPt (histidine-containing phosphotransfer) domain-containing protein